MEIQTRLAERGGLDPASEVLATVFREYPWTQWTVDPRDHEQRIRALQKLSLEHLGLPFGQVWVTTFHEVLCSVAGGMDSDVAIPRAVRAHVDEASADLMGSRSTAAESAERELA
jgi:hypothetical protein